MRAGHPCRRLVRRAVAVVLGLVLGALLSFAWLRWSGLDPVEAVLRAVGRPPAIVRDLHLRDDVAGYGLLPGASFRHTTTKFDVVYHVDPDGGGRVPGAEPGQPCVDVYGDSWTFGHGGRTTKRTSPDCRSAGPPWRCATGG